jgi:predicted DNA-binding transcriptional regulator YafY
MSKLRYIQRYLLIISKIRSEKYISLEELVDFVQKEMSSYYQADVSRRTIQRDLKDIRDFDISIEYSKMYNGYYIPEDEEQYSILERVFEPFNFLGSLPDFVFTEKRKPNGTEHLHLLIQAIRESRIVNFFYLKYDNSLSHVRKVMPYALKEFKKRWYLLAVEIDGDPKERGMIKTWGLDRICNLKDTKIKFEKDCNLDLNAEFLNSFGIYSDKDKETEEVILSFPPVSGRYNDAFPLHDSQEVLINDKKEFRIKLYIKITYDFIMELLSQSEFVKVITPLHLRKKLNEIHRKAIEINM